jgi:hypothetical protein
MEYVVAHRNDGGLNVPVGYTAFKRTMEESLEGEIEVVYW